MTEENNQNDDASKGEEKQNEDVVTKEDVNQIMSKINEISKEQQEFKEAAFAAEEDYADEQDEQNNQSAGEEGEKFINDMTIKQVVAVINSEVAKNVSEPILDIITKMQIDDELKDVASRHSDFGEFRKETLAIAAKNPSLPMEDAYKLAKGEAPKKEGSDESDPSKDTKNTPAKGTSGDKGGVSHDAVDESAILSLDEAAAKAVESALG